MIDTKEQNECVHSVWFLSVHKAFDIEIVEMFWGEMAGAYLRLTSKGCNSPHPKAFPAVIGLF
ncbi:hypothetical protein AIF64_00610 [Salmonella enterica]|nr:hypothetical protein [Salmonella enterica subsp. enterica serovar Newport]EAA7618331.1 hypothetical protein [Salmonella enterica]EBV2480780.1 hypothetical protein [Salmonella enterica subsp. enterica serovar Javiana]EBX9486988.1 hypothetical protein [Salmonella enterica subsp. enterica serovar Rubislaw]ECC2882791.1 hypothetical protein [Salmonella enterica subsp. arizonae]PVL57540.1 hypothetical protein C4803_04875 [Salmonella enterica subsp. arizonae serovar 51:g,z51:-]